MCVWYSLCSTKQSGINFQWSVSDECIEYLLAQWCCTSDLGAVHHLFIYSSMSSSPSGCFGRLHYVWSNCPKSETRRQDIWVLVLDCFQKVSWSWEIYIRFTEPLILYLKQELCNRSLFVKCFIIRTPFSNEIFHRKFHLHWQVPGTTAKPIELHEPKFKNHYIMYSNREWSF